MRLGAKAVPQKVRFHDLPHTTATLLLNDAPVVRGSASRRFPENPRRRNRSTSDWIGRGDRIRTCDPLVPNQVLYQAEPLPDRGTAEVARNLRGVNSRGSIGGDRSLRGDDGNR